MLPSTIFREYDIRGLEKTELSEKAIFTIASAYAVMLSKRNINKILIGHDNRPSSENYYQAAKKALLASGVEILDMGMILTPMLYWALRHYQIDGGIIITASHNPLGWNGLKLAYDRTRTLLQKEIIELKDLCDQEASISGEGSLQSLNILPAYYADILSRSTLHRPLKVVVNTANATSSFFASAIIKSFGCQVVELNTNPDPTYPHYDPNPAYLPMMEDTGRVVLESKADLGLAFDADGDRLGVVDEKGKMLFPDYWAIPMSQMVLRENPGASIIFDVKCSEALLEDIKKHGGNPVMWKTGHSYIKSKMKETDSPFAIEQSGHCYWGPPYYYGFDDALFTALMFLESISLTNKSVSQVFVDVPHYVSSPAYHPELPEGDKYKIVGELTEEFKKEGHRVIDINGARVYFENGWGLVRASSNLPALVLRFEAKTEEGLSDIEKVFRDKLSRFPQISKDWKTA